MSSAERLVIVEGSDDRNFVKGLLLRLGCGDCRGEYPGGLPRGDWGLRAPDAGYIRLVEAGGKDSLTWRLALERKPAATLEHVVVIGDLDTTGAYLPALLAWQQRLRKTIAPPSPIARLDVELLAWGEPEGDGPHDLEALVMAALSRVQPARAESIQRWLGDPPLGRQTGKARVWSHFAKWWEGGSASFYYQSLWTDPDLAPALEDALQKLGAWPTLERLARGTQSP